MPPPPAPPHASERVKALLARVHGWLRSAAGRAVAALAVARTRLRASRLRSALRPGVLVALALAALLIAGGAWGVGALLGSSAPSSANAAGPEAWLGVQPESLPNGGVVVATVAPGSPAEIAGLEPGDVITEINKRPIDTIADVQSAIDGLRAGDTIEIQVSRGSTLYTAEVTLVARRRGYP